MSDLLLTAKTLPDPEFRALGPKVLVMVDPAEARSELIEVVNLTGHDRGEDVGFGWVLSAAEHYYDLHPDAPKTKTPDYKDMTYKYPMPVKFGDRVFFRRFLRSEALMQGMTSIFEDLLKDYPGYEMVLLHINDVYGFVEDEQ